MIKGFLLIIGKGTVSILNGEIVVNSISMVIVKECTGIAMYSLFIAFVIAYDISRKTWKYGIYGLFMLIVLNILRLFTIIISTFFGVNVFNLVHDFLWPSTFFIFTLIMILFYIKRSSK
jgi:exosortase/archaeosortase family protein